jgi:hypothetical protein
MPFYYFDVRDRQGLHRDDTGLELADLDAAIAEGRRALADMSREALADGGDGSLEIVIRDHGEGPVKLSLSLTTEHPDDANLA